VLRERRELVRAAIVNHAGPRTGRLAAVGVWTRRSPGAPA
jgi:hypothetical protein